MAQAVRCLGIRGRAAIVALSRAAVSFHPCTELINKETEMTGVSDHLAFRASVAYAKHAERETHLS